MKPIGALFLTILLLCGCSQNGAPEAASLPTASSQSRQASVLSGPAETTRGGLRVYPLESANVCAMLALGEDLLIVRQEGSAATLIRLDGDTLALKARTTLPLRISEGAGEIQVYPERLHCYDQSSRQILVLSGNLEEINRVQVPQDAQGAPFLSGDGSRLFYCAENAVRCLELASGISRVLKEDTAPEKTLLGLLLEDQVLQLRWDDPALGPVHQFISAQTGQTLWDGSRPVALTTRGSRYYASVTEADRTYCIFGEKEAQPQMLLTKTGNKACYFLPGSHAAVLVEAFAEAEQIRLDYCPLEEGMLSASATFPARCYPRFFTGIGKDVFFLLYDDTLHSDVLCRWSPEKGAGSAEAACTYPYHTADDPDGEGLRHCAELARQLGERFGIRVLIGKEAAAAQPWDYDFVPEHQVPLIVRELRLLQQRLERYPAGFLETLAQCGESLTFCLVRSITGSAESGSTEPTEGILFWKGSHACLALAMGEGSEGTLYNELCHLIDTRVYGFSNAYDSWESLNPGDFRYDYDYAANRQRQSYQFLQAHSRSFIDMYSMSFPREDRARIMEYAMLPGHEALFQAPILQQKLLKLCTGIREAFDLEDYPEALPWEQYLNAPLFPTPEG